MSYFGFVQYFMNQSYCYNNKKILKKICSQVNSVIPVNKKESGIMYYLIAEFLLLKNFSVEALRRCLLLNDLNILFI
jgi:hypothetical protein